MKVLVVCEYSGRTRDAFIRAGFDAMSCDLLATEVPGPHYQGDCRDILDAEEWDLLIAHPDCTYLTCSAEWAYGDGPYHQKVKPATLVGSARREADSKHLILSGYFSIPAQEESVWKIRQSVPLTRQSGDRIR